MGSRVRFALLACALLTGIALVANLTFDRKAAESARPVLRPVDVAREEVSDDVVEPATELAPAAATARVSLEAPKPQPRVRSARPVTKYREPSEDEALVRVLVVTKETNEPIPDAQLVLMHEGQGGGTHVGRARARVNEMPSTGDDGWGEFIVPAGTAFEVSASWGVSRGAENVPALPRGATHEVTLRLPTQDDIVLFCRVVSAENGEPLRDASVQLRSESRLDSVVPAGPGGLFLLSGATWRSDVAQAQAPGFATRLFELAPGHSSAAEALEVRLSRVASLRARVTDRSGNPIAGAEVFLWTSRLNLFSPVFSLGIFNFALNEVDPRWTAITGDDGRCTVEDLPPLLSLSMELRVKGSPDQSEPALTLEPGEAREIELVIGGGVELRGIVADQFGEPVPARRVVLLRPLEFGPPCHTLIDGWEDNAGEATTDSRGRFRIPHVSEGRWLIGPSPQDPQPKWILDDDSTETSGSRHPDERRIACVAIPIEVELGTPQEIKLRADRGLYVCGRVLDSRGAPAYAHVFATWKEETLIGTMPSDDTHDGTFTLGPLPAGRWQVTAVANNGEANSDPVVVHAGDRDVLLRLKPGGRLEGEVVDGRTGLRRPAEIAFNARGQDSMSWVTANDSGFAIEGLGAGTYALFARAGDKVGWLADIDLAPGEGRAGLRILLDQGATLRLINRSARSGYCGVVLDDYRIDGFPTEAGKEATAVLPGGHATLHLYLAPDLEVSARTIDVDLVVGAVREVVFEDGQR